MIGARIMIAEDDAELRALLLRGLKEEGFVPQAVASAGELLDHLESSLPDALVVDIGLPDADGRDACQALRARGVTIPVLFLTARDALPDRLSGFASGGDDYLTKPFALAELAARLRAQLRRAGTDPTTRTGGLTLDPATHTAATESRSVHLTPTEFRVLALLVARPSEAVRRHELIRVGWPHGAIVHDNTLDTYIARLRRKLRTLSEAPSIRTVQGVGYALE